MAVALPDQEARRTWSVVLDRARTELPETTFLMWFTDVRPIALRDQVLSLAVPSQFVRERLQLHDHRSNTEFPVTVSAGVLWAGVQPAALFRSEDGGRSWALNRALWDELDAETQDDVITVIIPEGSLLSPKPPAATVMAAARVHAGSGDGGELLGRVDHPDDQAAAATTRSVAGARTSCPPTERADVDGLAEPPDRGQLTRRAMPRRPRPRRHRPGCPPPGLPRAHPVDPGRGARRCAAR